MRGYPPLHLALFALLFALMALPLARVTSGHRNPASQGPARPAEDAARLVSATVRVLSTQGLQSLSIKADGMEWVPAALQKTPAPQIEFHVRMPLSRDGLELALQAAWSPGAPPSALTVEIVPDELDPRSQTRWTADGKMQEVLTFLW